MALVEVGGTDEGLVSRTSISNGESNGTSNGTSNGEFSGSCFMGLYVEI